MIDTCKPHAGRESAYQNIAGDILTGENQVALFAWDTVVWDCGTPMCLCPSHLLVARPVALKYRAYQCVYCGRPASNRDHLVPRNLSGDGYRRHVLTVPSCSECNGLLGDRVLESITARRLYVHERIRVRHRKALLAIDVGEDDLEEYGPNLRGVIVEGMAKRESLEDRLAWPGVAGYDETVLADSGISDPYGTGLLRRIDAELWREIAGLLP